MWEGAFSSPASTCCQPQSSPTIRSNARSKSRATAGSAFSLIVTPAVVCGTKISAAAPSEPSSARSTSRVISISCVRRSLRRVISRTRLSYGGLASAPPSTRELDTYRDRIDRFIAELDEEYYLHYAGHKD